MLKLECSPEAIEALRYWRFHHPHPLVQLKMEVVLLHSQGANRAMTLFTSSGTSADCRGLT